jgi:hypothetical protein
VPVPLQLGGPVSTAFEQPELPHCVPLATYRHAPLPSQVPSRPQLPAAVQRPFDEPPDTIGRQRPFATLFWLARQDWQRPVQAFSQQMLETQAPFEHWLFPEQLDPLVIFAVQVPPAQ